LEAGDDRLFMAERAHCGAATDRPLSHGIAAVGCATRNGCKVGNSLSLAPTADADRNVY